MCLRDRLFSWLYTQTDSQGFNLASVVWALIWDEIWIWMLKLHQGANVLCKKGELRIAWFDAKERSAGGKTTKDTQRETVQMHRLKIRYQLWYKPCVVSRLKSGSWHRVVDLFRHIEIHFNTRRAVWHVGTGFDSLATALVAHNRRGPWGEGSRQMLLQSEWFNHSSGDGSKKICLHTAQPYISGSGSGGV